MRYGRARAEETGRQGGGNSACTRAASDIYENAWESAYRNAAFSSPPLSPSFSFLLPGDFIYRVSMKSTGQRLLSDNPLLPDKL